MHQSVNKELRQYQDAAAAAARYGCKKKNALKVYQAVPDGGADVCITLLCGTELLCGTKLLCLTVGLASIEVTINKKI